MKFVYSAESGLNLGGLNGTAGRPTQNSEQYCYQSANLSAAQPNNATATGTLAPICNSSNAIFNRGWTAGLASTNYGSLEFGLIFMANYWVLIDADRSGANFSLSNTDALAVVGTNGALGRYLGSPLTAQQNVSASNTVIGGSAANSGIGGWYANSFRYRSPVIGGFKGELSFSIGHNAAGSTPLSNDGRAVAGNIEYNDGGFMIGVGYMNYNQVNDTAVAKNGIASGTLAGGGSATYGCVSAPQNAAAKTGYCANWVTRSQNTAIIATRYDFSGISIGAFFDHYSVTNAGGYSAMAFGGDVLYDYPEIKSRFEVTAGMTTAFNSSKLGLMVIITVIAPMRITNIQAVRPAQRRAVIRKPLPGVVLITIPLPRKLRAMLAIKDRKIMLMPI